MRLETVIDRPTGQWFWSVRSEKEVFMLDSKLYAKESTATHKGQVWLRAYAAASEPERRKFLGWKAQRA